jgi:3-(3-hydroxy-phenyl)propionate hydroxylase
VNEYAVVVAGGGPTGLMLAAELTLAGVDVAVVERRTSRDLVGWRALGFFSRTAEVFDQRGIGDRFVEEAQVAPSAGFSWLRLDIGDFPSRRNYVVGLPQKHIERILGEWADELKVPVLRGLEVTGFAQDGADVDVVLSDGRTLRAQYLVGCDGGRSAVRKAAGIEFAGWDATVSGLIAEAELDEEPEWGVRRTAAGFYGFSRPEPGGAIRVQAAEQQVGRSGEPTLRELGEAISAEYGTDFGLRSAAWISRFNDTTRQAVSYRAGRVLLAGDSAHIHSPMGGQGLGVGVQDAVNLGWKLAQVVKGTSPDSLLDTYHDERHPVAARVLRNTMAQIALSRVDDRTEALREIVADLLLLEEPRKRIAGMMTGLDIRYDFGEGHPLLGRRMPDLDLVTEHGPVRTFTLLHDARPVLLNLGEPGAFDGGAWEGWSDRVKSVDAECVGGPGMPEKVGRQTDWELPVLGKVPAPAAVLIRPDGHVAWVGEPGDPALAEALTRWFGPAATE